MTDLATLGIRVQSEQAEIAEDRLDGMTGAAGRADNAMDRLALAARRADGAASTMNVAVRQQTAVMTAARASTGLAGHEMLNFTRQLSDMGMMAMLGQAPLLMLIQQGPQIADIFQSAAQRGVTFSAALRSIWVAAAPILAVLAPIAIAAGAVAGAFALLNRELSKGYPKDITDGLGLTEEQLKRVESKTVTFGDTIMATFTVIGRHIMDGPVGQALDWLGDKFTQVFDWIGRVVFDAAAAQAGVMIGTYRTIAQQWSQLPAVMGSAAVGAANAVIRAVEAMANGAINAINKVVQVYNAVAAATGKPVIPLMLAEVDIAEIADNYGGAARAAGQSWSQNVIAASEEARGSMRRFGADIQAEALARARRRALEEAGDPNKGGKSDADREHERAIKQAEQLIATLKKETAEIGLNAIQRRMLAVETAAAIAPTEALSKAILDAGAAWRERTEAFERSEAIRSIIENTSRVKDQLQMLELERDLIGATNVERARQLAMLQTELDLRRQAADLKQRTGVDVDMVNTPEGQGAILAAGNSAVASEENREALAAYNHGLEYQLDLLAQIDDRARSMASGLAEAFGAPGRALGDLMAGMTGLNSQLAEITEAERRYREEVGAAGVDERRVAMFAQERAQAQVSAYGDMLGAAKGFFKEGSDGYRALQAAEQAYRIFQFAMMVQAMMLGGQETAATVGQNAIRAVSHGVVAVARAIASLPFPLNIAAGAATIAALAAIGVRIGGSLGGGGGGGASPGTGTGFDPGASVSQAQGQVAAARSGQQAFASSVAQSVEVRVTADRDGLNAFVVSTAQREAAGVAGPMVAGSEKRISRALPGRVNRGIATGRIGEPAWGAGG